MWLIPSRFCSQMAFKIVVVGTLFSKISLLRPDGGVHILPAMFCSVSWSNPLQKKTPERSQTCALLPPATSCSVTQFRPPSPPCHLLLLHFKFIRSALLSGIHKKREQRNIKDNFVREKKPQKLSVFPSVIASS